MSTQLGLKNLLEQNTMLAAPELTVTRDNQTVQCLACGHRCTILPDRQGVCRVRFNRNGNLLAPAGYVAGLQVDPIEKKPFFHAFPGRNALSFGMLGCDYHCSFCQNWITSQTLRDPSAIARPQVCSAEYLVDQAVQHQTPVIVSTYNEPLITADWAVQIFRLAKQANITCGFVSNGNATLEVLEFIRPFVDLYKVDLKGFNDRNYRRLGGTLKTVLDTIRILRDMQFWVEVVTLVIPGLNDSDDELTRIADFLASVSVNIPWHVTAYRPQYKMSDPPATTPESLIHAANIGQQAGLKFVYPGNIPGAFEHRENTLCHRCNNLLIQRHGFRVTQNRMNQGHCPDCDTPQPGLWEPIAPKESTGTTIPTPIKISP
jgi:pyruvate formate lyase activating enzyme